MEDQVDAEKESYDPQATRRPPQEDNEAGQDSKDAGKKKQPARLSPIGDDLDKSMTLVSVLLGKGESPTASVFYL
jgi:hypothetical protein